MNMESAIKLLGNMVVSDHLIEYLGGRDAARYALSALTGNTTNKMHEFDPLSGIPTNDEEAELRLMTLASSYRMPMEFVKCLAGRYKCDRALGLTVLQAYENALRAFVGERRRYPVPMMETE